MPRLKDRYRLSIDAWFAENQGATFTVQGISEWIGTKKVEGIFPKSWLIRDILEEMVGGGWLREISLTSDLYGPKTRFVTSNATIFQIALSLKQGSYLSHASAAYLHSLTNEEPSTIYVNKEQAAKNFGGSLSQESIDRAFTRSPRYSNYRFWYMGNSPNPIQFVILSGKNSRDLGIEWTDHPRAGRVRLSNLERTLVDLAVRPHYSGGLQSVVSAYSKAKPNVNVNRLLQTLKQLNYSYPYHQAIGFLMTKAGFDKGQLEELKSLGSQFRFYLVHGVPQSLHDPEWNIYYPEDLI